MTNSAPVLRVPALSLREGDRFTLHLTAHHVDRYDHARETIVTVGDRDLNVSVNLDGSSLVNIETPKPRFWRPFWHGFLLATGVRR